MIKQVTLTIHGQVQGVFYRTEAQQKALELGLIGSARNNTDGTVTICAQGETKSLEDFIAWCRKGPAGAVVENIEISYEDSPTDQQFSGFEIF